MPGQEKTWYPGNVFGPDSQRLAAEGPASWSVAAIHWLGLRSNMSVFKSHILAVQKVESILSRLGNKQPIWLNQT